MTRFELARKLIHILGILIIIPLRYLGVLETLLLIIIVTLMYSISELYRQKGRSFPLFTRITKKALRASEENNFATAPLHFAGAIMLSLLFPVPINYATIVILTLGDGMSGLIGGLYGRTSIPYNKRKTFEGSLIGFVAAFMGSALLLDPIMALIGSLVGMGIESFEHGFHDNLPIAAGSGISMLLFSMF